MNKILVTEDCRSKGTFLIPKLLETCHEVPVIKPWLFSFVLILTVPYTCFDINT